MTAIAGGGSHTTALKSDGTVWTWGYNKFGQLGNGTTTNSATPLQVSGLSDVSAIAGGMFHTVALKSDGTVWAWGYNYYGQLGDGTTTYRTTPVQVRGMNLGSTTTTTPTPASSPSLTPSPTLPPFPTPPPIPTITQAIVFGYVQDINKDPIVGVTVTIYGDGYSDNAETNDNGYYYFNNIPACKYTLTYVKEGYQEQSESITLGAGEIKDMGTIILEGENNSKIGGYVVNVKGRPIKSVRVSLKSETFIYRTLTDEDGYFEFEDLDADTYSITAKKKGYKQARKTVTLENGAEKEVKIKMKKKKNRGSIMYAEPEIDELVQTRK